MDPEPIPTIVRLRRRKRIVGVVGILAIAVCAALVAATQAGPRDPRTDGRLDSATWRPPPPPRPEPRAPAARDEPRPRASANARGLRVRIVHEGEGVPDAVVRAVRFDGPSTVRPLSGLMRTDSDGVAELSVEAGEEGNGWLEIGLADARGMRHGFQPLGPLWARGGGDVQVPLPGAGRLRIRLLGLPADKVPEYVDVRFLTPEGDFEELFADLTAKPVEDGHLFETKGLPRVERIRIGRDGQGELPAAPVDHALSVEFPANPDGWLVVESGYSGPCVPVRTGDVLRVSDGIVCEYEVRFRQMPTAKIVVVDETDRPIEGATVVVGLRRADAPAQDQVFEAATTTGADGVAESPLWTGVRLPEWTPTGLVVVASAPGRAGRVLRTDGGWYGGGASIRLDPAPPGTFLVEGRLRHPDGVVANGVPLRIACAQPWNGHAAFPRIGTTTDARGGFALRVPEAHRAIFAFGRGLRIDVDGDQLEEQSPQAYWRRRFPGLPRATTTPERVELPPVGGSVRQDFVLEIPPP